MPNEFAEYTGLLEDTQTERIPMAVQTEPGDFFVVKLTDNPGNFAGLQIEIQGISGYSPILGWTDMILDEKIVDVLKLTNGREIQLAHCPGFIHDFMGFTKVKIKLGTRNYLKVWQKNMYHQRTMPIVRVHTFKETDREVIVNLDNLGKREFKNEVLLDFDVARSVKNTETGYSLTPRISEVVDRFTGISGNVSEGVRLVIIATNYYDTYTCFTNPEGQFMIRGMNKGNYSIFGYSGKNSQGQPIKRLFIDNVKVTKGVISKISA